MFCKTCSLFNVPSQSGKMNLHLPIPQSCLHSQTVVEISLLDRGKHEETYHQHTDNGEANVLCVINTQLRRKHVNVQLLHWRLSTALINIQSSHSTEENPRFLRSCINGKHWGNFGFTEGNIQ